MIRATKLCGLVHQSHENRVSIWPRTETEKLSVQIRALEVLYAEVSTSSSFPSQEHPIPALSVSRLSPTVPSRVLYLWPLQKIVGIGHYWCTASQAKPRQGA